MPRDPHRQSPALAKAMKAIEKPPRSSRARGGRSVKVKIPSWSTVDEATLKKGIGHPDYQAALDRYAAAVPPPASVSAVR